MSKLRLPASRHRQPSLLPTEWTLVSLQACLPGGNRYLPFHPNKTKNLTVQSQNWAQMKATVGSYCAHRQGMGSKQMCRWCRHGTVTQLTRSLSLDHVECPKYGTDQKPTAQTLLVCSEIGYTTVTPTCSDGCDDCQGSASLALLPERLVCCSGATCSHMGLMARGYKQCGLYQ